MTDDRSETICGAVYIPARAYNAPQMWRSYDGRIVCRDMGYARSVRLNALRIWASYEFWCMEPEAFERRLDDFLEAAREYGIGVLVSLFENCGVPPTEENIWTTDPARAFCVSSPHRGKVMHDPNRWGGPREFVHWFMDRYRDDGRLIGIEVMNEPGTREDGAMPFARAMLGTALECCGDVPLSIGSSSLANARFWAGQGSEILQFHVNFPASEQELRQELEAALRLREELGRPVWLTELQRIRSVSGWQDEKPPPDELGPDLASVIPIVREYALPWFFWSLMVKPAYLPGQRDKGTVNGLFRKDGSVWSLEDARAVSGNSAWRVPGREHNVNGSSDTPTKGEADG